MESELVVEEPCESRTLAVASLNPLMLIERAIERGIAPDQLKSLVDLQEQWAAAQAKSAYARAMTDAQSEMPVVVRDAENEHTRSRYARLETVTRLAKPVYTKHGFALSFSESESPKPTMKRIVCKVSHREGHAELHWIELPIDGTGAKGGKSSMNEVQGCISTNSYGHRVLTCNVFNITIADTDLDGEAPNPNVDSNAPKARPRNQRPQPAVSQQQLDHIKRNWLANNKDPDGNVERMRDAFATWARTTTQRTVEFDPTKSAQWTLEDYHACCDAMKIPTLEDLQRDAR